MCNTVYFQRHNLLGSPLQADEEDPFDMGGSSESSSQGESSASEDSGARRAKPKRKPAAAGESP